MDVVESKNKNWMYSNVCYAPFLKELSLETNCKVVEIFLFKSNLKDFFFFTYDSVTDHFFNGLKTNNSTENFFCNPVFLHIGANINIFSKKMGFLYCKNKNSFLNWNSDDYKSIYKTASSIGHALTVSNSIESFQSIAQVLCKRSLNKST